jgi:DNA-binding response OmpR family regulator
MARILVVDDDEDILQLAQKVLAHEGHTVFIAVDAMKAIEMLKETMFDLLVSDANMPHFSGFELVQTVRRDVRFRHLAICMLTGLREKKDIEKAIRAGVDDYIVKPIDPLLFSKKILALFEKRPPADHPEIRFSQSSKSSRARLHMNTTVVAMSELGLKILAEQQMAEGAIVELDWEFFQNLDVQAPPLKVLTCQAEEKKYLVQLIFLGAREAFLQKIRAWLYSHGSSLRKTSEFVK